MRSRLSSGLRSLTGTPFFMDKFTSGQTSVAYARICLEISALEKPLDVIRFMDDYGVEIAGEVLYEWLPIRC